MSITRKKNAPYIKTFVQHDDELPLAWLYFGPGAWGAKNQLDNRSIILPPFENPAEYDWRILKDQWVIAYAQGQTELDYRKRLAMYLLLDGAAMVHVFLPDQPANYRKNGKKAFWKPHEHYTR
jgi:hypothetical protein